MKKLLLLLLLPLAACTSNKKPEPRPEPPKTIVSNAKILAAGIFKITRQKEIDAKNTATGKYIIVKKVVLVKSTTRIKKRKGAGFGVRFVIEGSPVGKTIPVTIKLNHPPIRNAKTREKTTLSFYSANYTIGSTHHAGYGQSVKGSLPLGKYTLSLVYEGKIIMSQDFVVHR